MTADTPPPRAALVSLKLTGFRNYASLGLRLDGRPVILTGPNGAGKTNLLEAVSFLSPGRGLRGAALETVARQGGDGSWAVAATLENGAGAVDLGTGVALGGDGPEPRRTLRVNHAPARSTDALLEHLRVLWLTPAMDGLFIGPASDRRQYLDRAVLAIDRAHGARVNAFERAMRGRNRLLAESGPDANSAWLDAIETEMAELGVAIAAARRQWASLIAGLIAANERNSAFPYAEIALEGVIEHQLDGHPASVAEDFYRADLAGGRPVDARAGRTLAGPHRSDLRVRHGPKQAAAETCSTGEQKALLLAILLAQARLLAAARGTAPLMLLDEVAAHLDAERRAALFAELLDLKTQAWLTGTDAALFSALRGRAQFFAVAEARLSSMDRFR